jgi:F0F1-type ATP synthase membrane subunit b/b'
MRRLAIWFVLALGLTVLAIAQEHAPAGEKAGHGEAAEKDMTGLKWANFAILAVGLGYLIVKQAGPYFASRSTEIRKGIEDAQAMRADSETRAAAMEARLANLGVEVEAMRKSAREEAAIEGDRIRQETQRELAKIQAHADHEISSALKAAQIELKSYSGQLAIDLARTKVRDRMTVADQDTLVRSFVADLGRQGPSLEKGSTQ